MLAMERPVSMADELATERMIRRLKGWRLTSNRMASRDWSASGMVSRHNLNLHCATDSNPAETPLLIAWRRPPSAPFQAVPNAELVLAPELMHTHLFGEAGQVRG